MRELVFLLWVLPLIVNTGLGIFLAVEISRHRATPSTLSLLALIAAASLWSFGYAMEFISSGLDEKIFWAKFQYFGITSIPLAWFSFAFHYMRSPGWFGQTWRQRMALCALPLLTLALVWTNELHGLIWRDVQLQPVGSFQILALHYGPAFWIYLAYSYCLLLIGSIQLMSGLLVSFQASRWRTIMRLFAILVPWIGNLLYITGLNPIPHLDWSPYAFTISGLLFVITLYHNREIDLLPIAQKAVFAVLPECLLVFDAEDHLIDVNESARKLIENDDVEWKNKPLKSILPELARWDSQAGIRDDFRTVITRDDGPDHQFYDLHVAPLLGSNQEPVGRLVTCHNITRFKLAQAQLEKIRAQLEETVAERTAELRHTVDQLQVELTQRSLAEKRFEDVVESDPDAMVVVDQAGEIKLVNAQVERIFGYSRDELLGDTIERLIEPCLHQTLYDFIDIFLAEPSTGQVNAGLPLTALRKDGSAFPVEITLGTLNTSEGVWIACSARDISERRRAEEEQNRLIEEIKQSREDLRAFAIRLSEAQEFNQRQIAAELHDRVGQSLTGLNLNLQIIQNQLPQEELLPLRRRLEDSMRLVEETTRQVRGLMADLNPPLLEEYGLNAALRFACEQFMERTGIETTLTGEEISPRLSQREEMALFRIVQEGLNNVVKHARATKVQIRVDCSRPVVALRVEDNGLGFDPETLNNAGSQPHWGLLSIQERAGSIGGELEIDSVPGQGTCLKIVVRRGVPDD